MSYLSIQNYTESPGQSFEGQESLTVPNMALSIKDILRDYTRGAPVEQFKPLWMKLEDLQDKDISDLIVAVDNMDKFDRIDAMRNARLTMRSYAEQVQKQRAANLEKEAEEARPGYSNDPPVTPAPVAAKGKSDKK